MFGIGMPELILILAVALIVIGPKKLPDLAKSLGKAMGEFKKATNEIKDSMQLDSGIQEVKTSFKDLENELKKPVETTASGDSETDAAPSADTATAPVTPLTADEARSDEAPATTDTTTAVPELTRPDAEADESDASTPDDGDDDAAKTPTTR